MLYHFQVGFPKGVENNLKKIGKISNVEYLFHAKKAAMNDRYGIIDLPKTLNLSTSKIIEVEVLNNRVTKIVFRTHYDVKFDLVVVMNLPDLSVRTVWLNSKTDKHRTLDRSKYDKP